MVNRPQSTFDANSWEFTQRVVRIGHNRQVRSYFRDENSENSTSTGRAAIKTALTIRDEDSAMETLVKMTYFKQYLETDITAVYPDGWQIKRGQNISQLAIIFRNADRNSTSGDYPLHIPHYDGTRRPRIPSYEKGDHWARWTLTDNSQIIVNAKTEAEALRVIRRLEEYVERKFRTKENPGLVTGRVSRGTYRQFRATPIRADYFPNGKEELIPKWREYF